jgi:hypothetical protein
MARATPKLSRDQQTVQKATKDAGKLIATLYPTSTSTSTTQATAKEAIKLKTINS